MSYRIAFFCVAILSTSGCERGGSPSPESRRIETGGSVSPLALPTPPPAPASISADSPGAVVEGTSDSDEYSGKPAVLSDQQIAAITDDVNSAEIDQAQLARNRAQDPRIKSFAAMMIKHHTEAKSKQLPLALKPAVSPLSTTLEKEARETLKALESASNSDFDVAYINAQIFEHQKVADTIDRDLMPSAKSRELKAYLADLKPTVEAHLRRAREIGSKLSQSASAN
jgi:putative membrane protein